MLVHYDQILRKKTFFRLEFPRRHAQMADGHPPFGHAGEEILNEKMFSFGGFDHNEQALRILCELEKRYPNFIGLNLCWETLDGIIKHNGIIDKLVNYTIMFNNTVQSFPT